MIYIHSNLCVLFVARRLFHGGINISHEYNQCLQVSYK